MKTSQIRALQFKQIGALAIASIGLSIGLTIGLTSSAQAQSYSYDFEELTPGSISPTVDGNINAIGTNLQGNPYGWYGGNSSSTERVTVSGAMNSPWDVGGSQSAVMYTVSDGTEPTLYNYFTDRTGLANYSNPTSVNVDGSLGASLTGSGYSVSWDFYTDYLASQPLFELRSSDANPVQALSLDVRYDTKKLRYYNGSTAILSENALLDDTWYRFEVVDIDVANGTYGFNLIEWDSINETATVVASDSDLEFRNTVTDIDYFRMKVNGGSSPTYYLDNFSIVPEAKSASLLFGLGACLAVAGLKRRR
ncbi:hypothetical protein QEH59_00555 [Coraliomargarita sp. SDUM461004]|uniref:PEP-CTERM sorting domain-containing protein n=1 Tax=Thalassobacterium sedimentorum TaxID=3041258 RepID=A0ABU1ADU8_9BACT|nr:hypothetical protein [Coraliomargarita sp. SDUM461004]MDQ8192894.1 hypothetical protein [Coraliomargarita sp. SDUM461004]